MNPQVSFVLNRQFWFGVAGTVVIGFFIVTGVPNLMRAKMPLNELNFGDESYPRDTGFAGVTRSTAKLMTLSAGLTDKGGEGRQTVRTGSIDMLVRNPKEISEKIRLLAEQAGGFLVSSENYGGDTTSNASLTIRIPADKYAQVRAQISSLGLRIESEKLQAQDVTKEYVDQSARLRNLHAQEIQYLGILKRAKTIKDTIEVSDKLNEVRGEIEEQQAEFDLLSKQVETVALNIALRAESDAQIFGLHWRPLYQLKFAAKQGLEGIGDYAASMAAFLFYLPAVLLWLATILIGAGLGWRILRWAGQMLFVPRPKAV